MRTWIIGVALWAAGVGCKKADKKEPPGPAGTIGANLGSGSDQPAEPAGGKVDPWAGAPAQASTLGATSGDEMAKINFAGAAAVPTAKVSLASIPRTNVPAIKAFAGVSQTGFRVVYEPSTDATHDGLRQVLAENRVFETLTESLNKLVRLPSTVDVELVDCGTVNAFYDPTQKRVIVCYELMTYFAQMFQPTMTDQNQLGMAVIGATTFAFFHEVGHGLIDLLDLPAVGREEDSVDQLATLILISDGDDGVGLALSGAHWFQLQEKAGTNQTPFSDEHAFDMQRFYNIMCLVYGSDPAKYQDMVTSGTLPAERAQRCPEEYRKISHNWEKLLQPHLTNAAAENVDYKPPVNPAETSDPWAGGEPTAGEPPPPAPTPTGHAITCEAVAEKSLELIGAEAVKQAENMTQDQIAELKTRLEAELPAMAQQLLAQCAKEDWPDKDRQCLIDADTLQAATSCGVD